jgi:NADH-quinone oxidoreductase subunit L
MLGLLWLIPVLPFISFLILGPFGPRMSRRTVALIGAGSVGVSALVALLIAASFLSSPPAGNAYSQVLWTWMSVGNFEPAVALYLDPMSLVFILVVTVVGFLIHVYSVAFMEDYEEGYSRFFAYMNLFVGSMLTLVLADNLLLLYLGWEGVGMCSFLLIGFWYKDPANGRAARKAFVVTRVGDTAMAIGLFMLFTNLGTLQIQALMHNASQQWAVGAALPVAAALLLLGGAVGKSAQLPLQTWLPDAMAGPTPVSALIHAATMVTAGVYLIARTNVIFMLAPVVMHLVAIVGMLTLLLAGFSALAQWDIKRVLAYSTISQIGYMFLALGVGAWSAAIFHFMTHAFFKALLFLAAGVVIIAMDEEHNMFKMGGLRKHLPVVFWTFLIGACSLSALPLVTAGFYSKDLILWDAYSSTQGSPWLWLGGLFGAFLTSIYSFRMVFLVFFGPLGKHVEHKPGRIMEIPLVILAILSIIGGFVNLPETLGNLSLFSDFVERVLPATVTQAKVAGYEGGAQVIAGLVSILGVYVAYIFFLQSRRVTARLLQRPAAALLHRFWLSGWGFDWLYDWLFVRPYVLYANLNRNDAVDAIYRGIAGAARGLNGMLSATQTGRLRWYAAGIALGAVIALLIVVIK